MTNLPYNGDLDKIQVLAARLYRKSFIPLRLRASPDPEKRKAPLLHEWQRVESDPWEWQLGEGIGLRTGKQLDGTQLYVLDYDHKPEQGIDAPSYYARAMDALPADVAARAVTSLSTSGRGRYIIVKAHRELRKGYLRDLRGRKIGDFLGNGAQVVLPTPDRMIQGKLDNIPVLTDEEFDELLRVIGYQEAPDATAYNLNWSAILKLDTKPLLRDGMPARLQPGSNGYRVLKNYEPVRDTSDARYLVGHELITFGYSDEEAAALLYDLCEYGVINRKGVQWLRKDIERIIGKARQNVTAAQIPAQEQQTGLPIEPNLGGRPRKRQLEEFALFLERMRCGDRVPLSQPEIAERLNVSVRTIRRWEAELMQEGRVKRETTPDRHVSYLRFLDADNSTPTHTDIPSEDTGTDVLRGGVGGSGAVRTEKARVCADCGTPTQPERPSGPWFCTTCGLAPVTMHLITEALDLYEGQRAGAARTAAVVGYVYTNGRPDARLEEIVSLERYAAKQRAVYRADLRLKAKLRTLTDKQLRTKEKSLSRKQADAHTGGNAAQAWVFGRMAWFVAREWERREPLRKMLGKGDTTAMLEAWKEAA